MIHGKNNAGGDKAAHFWKTMAQLVVYCKKYWLPICVAIGFSVAATVLTVIAPEQVKNITNLIASGLDSGINMHDIIRLGIIVALLYGFSFIFI